ncbi:MAG: ImmA/IrrE family metallo-endopeptidase [Methanobacteriaceae archaeon]|jgi:Zn-dependent peptidase ImmA (M78 family)|nr:ImmA/IrrE family metallo-endopeptidase [Methanobacteriaceae archaeon]
MKNYHETNELAADLRRQWGIDQYAPIDIFSTVVEKIDNLTLIFMVLDNETSGCCCQSKNDKLILINSIHSKGRQNFTLAHELYHILYEKSKEWIICSYEEQNNDSEKEADNFASSLLLPINALIDYKRQNKIKKWSLNDIIRCEQYFQISHLSMLCRLRKENQISYEEFNDYRPNIKSNASKLGFSTDLYESSSENKKYYSTGEYIPLTEKIYNNNKISIGKKEELLLDVYRSDIVYNL